MSTIVPIYDPNRGYRHFHRKEIYNATESGGQYVPNPDDTVFDPIQGLLVCTAVDGTSLLSTLTKWVEPYSPTVSGDVDVLLGSGPGYISGSYRLYYDDSVSPALIACDARLRFYGTGVDSIKVFKGTDYGDTGNVISRYYDQTGDLLGNNIPVRLVQVAGATTLGVKAPLSGYTLDTLDDADTVTVVAYDDQGKVVSIATLVVKRTGFIRAVEANQVYVESISIKTPFLAPGNPRNIQVPQNLPVSSLGMIGVVTYSDGRTLELPLDGSRFTLYGMDTYISTVEGDTIPLVLSYRLASNEFSNNLTVGANRTINVEYTATSKSVDGAYSVKLFGYPSWVNSLTGYKMTYWLYNLDRDITYNVTQYVELAANSNAFNPLGYGSAQQLTVMVDLSKVSPEYVSYRHVQTIQVSLLRTPDVPGTLFNIGFTPGQTPLYGDELTASLVYVSANNWTLNMASGADTYEEWLDRVYYASKPLHNASTEVKAPLPNLMRLVFSTFTLDLPMTDWNRNITVANDLANGQLLYVKFIRQYANTDLQLSVSGLSVRI